MIVGPLSLSSRPVCDEVLIFAREPHFVVISDSCQCWAGDVESAVHFAEGPSVGVCVGRNNGSRRVHDIPRLAGCRIVITGTWEARATTLQDSWIPSSLKCDSNCNQEHKHQEA